MGDGTLDDAEQELLNILKQFPKGATAEEVMGHYNRGTIMEMTTVMNQLSQHGFVDFLQLKNNLMFRLVSEEERNRMGKMNTKNEQIIYNLIKAEGSKGIWVKEIKNKSGLHQKVVTDTIKLLEKARHIKAVKSVKHPTKKLYMLYDCEASEDITGGVFFTEQELDVEFVDGLSQFIYDYIRRKSKESLPANFNRYPTAMNVLKAVKTSGLTTVDLTVGDIQMILDRLVFDDKIQKVLKMGALGTGTSSQEDNGGSEDEMVMGDDDEFGSVGYMYKAVKGISNERLAQIGLNSPLTEIPCGKCPVANFCKTGGPVNPEECVYFDAWLNSVM